MMKAHQEAKAAGMKSLAHMAELTGEPAEKLRRWHRDRPRLFSIVLFGCQKVLENNKGNEQ